MCDGAVGKQESAALPTMTERRGDHSVSAETREVGALTIVIDSCVSLGGKSKAVDSNTDRKSRSTKTVCARDVDQKERIYGASELS